MIDFIITLGLGCHLLCVNLAAGGPLVCVALEVATYFGSTSSATLARRLAKHVLASLVFGGLLGVFIGYLSWSDTYAATFRRMVPKFHTGGMEFVFSFVMLSIYSQLRTPAVGLARKRLLVRCLPPFLAGTNLLYHFPLLFMVFARETLAPTAEFARIDARAFRILMLRGDVLAQAVHFWLATIAVSCVWLVKLCPSNDSTKLEPSAATHGPLPQAALSPASGVRVWSAGVALLLSMLQVPVGIWLFGSQSGSIQARLLGGNLVVAASFGISVGLALWLLHTLANIVAGEWHCRLRRQVVVLMVVLVLLMTHVRRSMIDSTKPNSGTGHVQGNIDSPRSQVTGPGENTSLVRLQLLSVFRVPSRPNG